MDCVSALNLPKVYVLIVRRSLRDRDEISIRCVYDRAVSAPELALRLLGTPLVEVDGAPLSVDTRKATALLAFLALEGGTHNRDSLAALLWPEYEPERARAALRRTLSTLKAALGDRWLSIARDAVSLERDGVRLDVEEFRELSVGDDLAALERAVFLHRGTFLAGFGLRDSVAFDDWQSFRAETLTRELCAVLDRLADGLAARRDFPRALEHARRRLALDSLNESAHRRLIQLYGASGERAAALSQYRDCVRTLHRELGVAPTDETTALYRAIREGAVAPSPGEPAAAPARRRLPLVGREPEWRALLDAYAAVGPDGRLVVLDGETGLGKTRLAGELVAWARARGITAATARCVEDEEGLAFGSAIELLRSALRDGDAAAVSPAAAAEAARLVPELGTPPTPSLDGPGAQARFLEGVATVIVEATGGVRPGVVVLDDVHWADASSLEVLAFLTRRLRGRPLLLVATWRSEDTPPGHPARRILAQAARDGLGVSIPLSRLERDEVAELATAAGASHDLAERLYEETGGVPFFVVEYLDSGAVGEPDGTLPPGVRGLLESRIAAASEIAGQVLAAAAVIGRPFDADLVREVSGRSDDETVAALEELASRGIVVDAEGDTHAFRHEQARRVAYELASAGRRRLLHRRAATGLEARDRSGAFAGAIGQHLRLAGREAEAAEWFRLAGVHARGLYANAEALAHFREALALEHDDPGALHEEIGDLQTLAGDYAEALESYETAAALGPAERLASIAHRIGLVHHRRGEWELAESAFEEALAALADGATGLEARIVADRSLNAHRRRRDLDAEDLAEHALELADDAGDRHALAQAHNILGILASGRGDHAEARHRLERSLALSTDEGDLSARAAALNNLALALRAEGELDRALELTEEALTLCAAVGDRHREAALTNNVADLLNAAGRRDEAMERLKAAVAIFAEIGDGGATEPEIWKLVEW
jgi:DNA-binding SARP family transcriptional activator/predicted ATPase